jgi:amidase
MTIARREFLVGTAAVASVLGARPSWSRPAPSDVLGRLDATALGELVSKRAVTPLELVDAAIRRIEAIDGRLNAVVTHGFERAREVARNRLSGKSPFEGVPFLIKDLIEYPGMAYVAGSRALRGNIATFESDYVRRIDGAGLVVLGKSATPEFGLIPTTEPLLGPPTRNPWNTSYSCGGSSGGSAVAVAAGMVPFAHASDGGGSIRMPSSICGLFGLKPSRGRNVEARAQKRNPDVSIEHCVSRSVRDSARLLSLTERRDADAPHPPAGFVRGPSKKRLRVAFTMADALGVDANNDVRAAVGATARLLESLGHTVEVTRVPIDGEAFVRHFRVMWAAGAAQTVRAISAKTGRAPDETMFEPFTLGFAKEFSTLPADAIPNALAYFAQMTAGVNAFFGRFDALLSPVLSFPAVKLGHIAPTVPLETLWGRLIAFSNHTAWQNITGVPAMSVPLGMSPAGLPIGSQFTAAAGAEGLLLSLAYELEAARPWKDRWPAGA